MPIARWIVVCFIGFCLWGCGGGGGSPALPLTVTPVTQDLPIKGTQTFTAAIANKPNAPITWTVREGVSGGTITPQGVYTAPATAGVYHVVAHAGGGLGNATVTVHPIVTIAPAAPTVLAGPGNTQTFTATVAGTSNQAVVWTIQEGATGGAISAGGVYSPPGTPGTYHIIATSAADTSVIGATTVTVQGGNIQGTIQ